MTGVEEIEKAIEQLSSEDFSRLAQWIMDRDQDLWDEKLDADSKSGKLDFLLREAIAPNLADFPPAK